MDEKSVGVISLQKPLSWKVYVDSAANHRKFGVGLVLVSIEMITIEKSLRLGFSVTNNEAKYETLLVGMTMFQKMGGKAVEIFSDSRLVVGQIQGEWRQEILECRNIWTRLETYNLDLSLLLYHKFLEVEMHMQTLLPHWQPPRHKTCLG